MKNKQTNKQKAIAKKKKAFTKTMQNCESLFSNRKQGSQVKFGSTMSQTFGPFVS